jgi:hypothetical protein
MVLTVLSLHPGCAWVRLSDEGRTVQVVANTEVTDCQRLGNTRVSVLPKVWFVPRAQWAVEGELEALARNEGAKLDGNTVTAMRSRAAGERGFAVYRCED